MSSKIISWILISEIALRSSPRQRSQNFLAEGRSILTMTSLFERAFLRAVKRCRVNHPTRLRSTIRSFHQVYSINYSRNPISTQPPSDAETEKLRRLDETRQNEETVISGDAAKMLMRRGFGVIPKCMYN